MAISNIDGIIGAARQDLHWAKTTTRTSVAATFFSMFDVAGMPGAGTLAGSNTANGIVPTSADAGYPIISAFAGGATGYLGPVAYNNTVSSTLYLYDRLFVAGAYAFNANTALTSQPSFASRVPNLDYTQCEIWVEQVTAGTGNQAVTVTYTNQAGVTGRSTGAVGIGAAPTIGRCWQLPLQAGDKGVQAITNVQGTVATAGTFNVMILRPLVKNIRCHAANAGGVLDPIATGYRQIYANTALYPLVVADSTSTGLPYITAQVQSG